MELYAIRIRTAVTAIGTAALIAFSSASVANAAAVTVRRAAVVNCGAGRHALVHTDATGREHVTCAATRYRTTTARHIVVRKHRSLAKSAAVIGGSTAAGAGVGALVGGGKGALVGGAAGAAAGTIYDQHKRHEDAR